MLMMQGMGKMRFSLARVIGYWIGGVWTAWGGRQRIEAKQLKNLRRLVRKARAGSPYFQRLYADLPDTAEIELKDLPVTTKTELMAAFDDWLTDRSLTLAQAREHMDSMDNLGVPIGRHAVFRTSGSSGEPAVIVTTSSMLEFIFGLSLARLTTRQLLLEKKLQRQGVMVIISGGNGHFAGVGMYPLMQRLAPRLARELTFIAAEQAIEATVAELNALENVTAMLTYPSMLSILTREKEAGRLKIEPKLFKVAGETFTPELRERALRAFPSLEHGIVDVYGCTECLLTAFKCECGRQHVVEDWVILEAVDENNEPVPDGELSAGSLLTVLANDVQPFIRYDLGDRVRFYRDACPCGSPCRSFQIEGRQATLVRVGDVSLSPLAFDLEHEWARRVQLVQTAERAFEVRAELTNPDKADEVFEQVIQSVSAVFASNGVADVSVGKSDAPVILAASGKFHEVVPV